MKRYLFFLSFLTLLNCFSSKVGHKQKTKETTLGSNKHFERVLTKTQNIFLKIKEINSNLFNTTRTSKLDDLNWKGLSHEEIIFTCNKKLMEITK